MVDLIREVRSLHCDGPSDLPDGQITEPAFGLVQPAAKKYFAHSVGQISGCSSRVPLPDQEGRFAIVTNVGQGDAMDALAPPDERR